MNEVPHKRVFLKTYGKHKKKLSAWILPDCRKQAFDSTLSTDGDQSVFEPSKAMKKIEEKKKGLGCKEVRHAKRRVKKKKSFTEEKENNPSSPSFQLVLQTKTARPRRKPPSTSRGGPPPKRKARLHFTDTSSEEENIWRPPLQHKSRRKNQLTTAPEVAGEKKKKKTFSGISETIHDSVIELQSSDCQKSAQQRTIGPSDQVLPADRFVTRRMPAGCFRTKVAQAAVSILNSSEDFTTMGAVSTRPHQGQKRKLPPVFNVSSTESSGNVADVFSFNASSSIQDVSLNKSLALCPRKPRFCSTPAPPNKQPINNSISISDSSPSCSVSRNNVRNSNPAADLFQSPFHLQLSVTNIKDSDVLLSQEPVELSKHVASATDSQKSNTSPLAQVTSSEKLLWPAAAESADSDELIVATQPSADSPQEAWLAEVAAAALRSKCTVKLEKLNLELKQQEEAAEANEVETCCGTNNNDGTSPVRISRRLTASNRSSRHSEQMEAAVAETVGGAAALTAKLKEECLRDKFQVKIKRVSIVELRKILQDRHSDVKANTDVSICKSEAQVTNSRQSNCDIIQSHKETWKAGGSTVSQESSLSDKDESLEGSRNRKNHSQVSKVQKRKRRSTSTDRPATNRKACVSGLSVTRWKNKDFAGFNAGRAAHNKTGDSSISEMMAGKHKQPRALLETTMTMSTPVRMDRLNLSSLLTDLTPNTHTWSRLKAALSVHRKGVVLHTPKNSASVFTPRRAELVDISQDLFASPFRSSLPSRLQSQLVNCEESDLSDAEKVFAECNQQRPLPWEGCILPERMKQCVKIGEGTFGEVFSTVNASGETVALKLIPVEGSEKVNGEDQKSFGEILHEIIISKELSSLKEKKQNQTHGFIGLMDLHCVQGRYPPDFLDAWDKFDQLKGSENDRPDFFQKDQIFIILEFEFGGVDLENSDGMLSSLVVAKSILHQVAAALSIAEQELHFEHRDLHWGNVLVRPTTAKKGSFLLDGEVHSLETKGVLVSIIDYSLSRLEIDDLTVSCDISADEELFMGQGDYQFDIYRMMREENGNNWNDYHPHTNVLWLHYLCSKLLSMKYRTAGGKAAKDARKTLSRFYQSVLQYSSATEALHDSPLFR